MIRAFDIFFSLLGILMLFPILITVFIIVWFENRSPIFFQKRVGQNLKPFILIKFRTMPKSTLSVATHLVDASKITFFGHFLRRTKIDELPQLFNVLRGDMSLVGPRPCLFNQNNLIFERVKLGVFKNLPGITGLAQIRGIDMSKPSLLAKVDSYMLKRLNLLNYFKYIFLTIFGKLLNKV